MNAAKVLMAASTFDLGSARPYSLIAIDLTQGSEYDHVHNPTE